VGTYYVYTYRRNTDRGMFYDEEETRQSDDYYCRMKKKNKNRTQSDDE
jgi:hypothetical protein